MLIIVLCMMERYLILVVKLDGKYFVTSINLFDTHRLIL